MRKGFRQLLGPVFTLVIFCKCTAAQVTYFRHYEIENGLSNNTVITALQDRDGFLWFGTSDGLNRFDGHDFKIFSVDPRPATGAGGNAIFHLYLDKKGTLWVGTSKGIYYFNKKEESFTRLPGTRGKWVRTIQSDTDGNLWFVEDAALYKYVPQTGEVRAFHTPALQNITTLYLSANGTLWLGCKEGVLARYQPAGNKFDYYRSPEVAVHANTIETICEYDEHSLLVGTSRTGLQRFDTRQGQWSAVPLLPGSREAQFVRSVIRSGDQEYWVGTEAGLFILNGRTGSIRHFHKVTGDKYALSDNAIYSLYKDREGGIWVGTYFGGINYFPNHSLPFEKFFPSPEPTAIRGSVIREMVPDHDGYVWIGTEDKGLSRFDPVKQVFKNFPAPTNIHGLLVDQNNLYVGTFENGLYVWDIRTQTIRQHHTAYANNGLYSNFINLLYKTTQGDIYVCTAKGLYTFDPPKQQFKSVEGLSPNGFYAAILQDSKDRLWIGTHDSGLYYIERGRPQKLSLHYRGSPLFADTKVVNLSEDRDSNLWVCTEAGLYRISLVDYAVTGYNTASGLPSNIVYSSVQDARGNIWVSTSRGLAYIDVGNNFCKVFRQTDGLLSNQFNHRSAFRDTAGNIYFGSLKGFIRFNPDRFVVSPYVPPIFFTRLQVYNKEVSANSLYTFSENVLLNGDQVRLPHNRSTFSLDFAALSYTAPENIEYAYKLEGQDEKWNFIGKDRRIHFNNLSPGRYVIRIKSTNSNGEWMANERSFAIEVMPPFWKTGWAYLIYAIGLAAIVYAIARFFYNRNREKHQRQMEIFALNKEKELYQQKIDFFTRVAHEIRTPLTLIKAPVDKLFRSVESLPEIKREIVVMNKNTDRLLTLTNQLLDFQKVESGNYLLHTEARDIVAIVREVYNNFQPKADQKGIQHTLVVRQVPVICNIEEEGFIKIVSNLLDNAIKYGLSRIQLEIAAGVLREAEQPQAIVRVSNDGDIIPEQERKYIFDAFYRAGNSRLMESTGIGLSLARSLALLHKGNLEYDTDGKYNMFTLVLPLMGDRMGEY